MPKQVRWRRGTTAEHATFTGAQGEVTVDITKKTLVVHDGVTPGGHPVSNAPLEAVRSTTYERAAIAFAPALVIDFKGASYQEVVVTGNVTIATTNRATSGIARAVAVRLIPSGGPWTLTFAVGITAYGAALPASLAAGKEALLSLTSFGPTEGDTRAVFTSVP
jgi:hypothetical protein